MSNATTTMTNQNEPKSLGGVPKRRRLSVMCGKIAVRDLVGGFSPSRFWLCWRSYQPDSTLSRMCIVCIRIVGCVVWTFSNQRMLYVYVRVRVCTVLSISGSFLERKNETKNISMCIIHVMLNNPRLKLTIRTVLVRVRTVLYSYAYYVCSTYIVTGISTWQTMIQIGPPFPPTFGTS